MEVVVRQHTAAFVCPWCVFVFVEVERCVSGVRPGVDEPQTPSGGWLWWMVPGSSDVWAVTRQPGLIDSFSFSAAVAKFWWRLVDGCWVSGVIPALLITSWQVREGKPFNTAAGSGATHTYTHLLPWMCMFAQPPRFPYRITDYNPSIRPGRKASDSMKLFIHQSPVHLCMYEFIDLDDFIVLKSPLTSSHTSEEIRCLVQNCNNEWVTTAHKSLQLWFKVKCRLLTIGAS